MAEEEKTTQVDAPPPVKKTKSVAPLIYTKMADVLEEVQAIVKKKQSTQVNYAFRSIEDVMNAIHPILSKHRLFILPDVVSLENLVFTQNTERGSRNQYQAVLTMRYTVMAEDGSSVSGTVAAEATDYSDKATQQAGSYCFKDFILRTWIIPTQEVQKDGDEKQPNRDNVQPAPQAKPVAPVSAAPEKMNGQTWKILRDGLAKFELTAPQFNNWSVKTLRASNIEVPKSLDDLPMSAGRHLLAVAKYSVEKGELVHEIPISN